MSNQKSEGQSNDGRAVDNKVDREIHPSWTVAEQMPHPSESKPWLFKPGQSGNPAGKQSLANLTLDFRRKLLDKDSAQAAKVATAWLNSGDPFVQKLYFEYIVGKPKVQQESTGDGSNNIELMRSAMQAFSRLQELEAENARMRAELEKRTIVLNAT